MRLSRIAALSMLLLLVACSVSPTPPPVAERSPSAASSASAAPSVAPTSAASAAPSASAAPATAASATPPITAEPAEPITYTLPVSFTPIDATTFASFKPQPVAAAATNDAPAIAPDLSNVAVPFILSPEQRAKLGQQGFVISPGDTKEFFELYERARYNYEPVFVTSDSLLHVYHLLFDRTLRVAEQEQFAPMLATLDWALLNASLEQAAALQGTPWAEAARRNAAYFAVAVKLLNPDWPVPERLRDLTDPDLEAIAAHNGIGPSAIFPNYPEGEDWSQYVPRGHYTRSEQLQRYFRAMMWHGRITLRQADATETQQAALMTQAWQSTEVEGKPATAVWRAIYDPTVFFVGRSDDLTPTEYAEPFNAAYGETADPRALVDEAKFAQFTAAIAELRPPQILGMVINEELPVDDTTKGLRFMGQRFVPDAMIFRQLIFRNVQDRYLPKGLDLFAAMGSQRALEHLQTAGDTAKAGYQEKFAAVKQVVDGYDEQTWTQNLYWSWLYTLKPMLQQPGAGYPQFMRSSAWADKQLNTALGSWTELKHDTILYAKQVYAERGAGALPPPVPEPPKGYVEPVPDVYARISALAAMTLDGLKTRGLLAQPDEQALTQMVEIANRLQTISEKELRGEALTAEEYEKIRFYGADIESLTFAAGKEAGEPVGPGGTGATDNLQAAIVADVATDPRNGLVLEEGVGRVFPIYAVVPIEGKLVTAKGGVFSHYEFTQPLSDRLTDEAWQQRIEAGDLPEQEPWKQALMVQETSATPLADTIRQFNDKLTDALWFTDITQVEQFLVEPELSDTKRYIDQLKAQGQFVGLKRLSLEYLSFDFQDANNAVVTTRERFSEELRKGDPTNLEAGEPPIVGVRQPYETTAAYTMVKRGDAWQITKIVVNNPPDDWQQP
jgi:hypothetical protein